jgi:hypothetical protein
LTGTLSGNSIPSGTGSCCLQIAENITAEIIERFIDKWGLEGTD